jgi:hypothetical protein
MFNDRLNAVIALFFMGVVAMLIFTSAREWWLILSRRKQPVLHEAPFLTSSMLTP